MVHHKTSYHVITYTRAAINCHSFFLKVNKETKMQLVTLQLVFEKVIVLHKNDTSYKKKIIVTFNFVKCL